MKNLNLVPILKNHIGETFYCTILGNVKLVNINEDEDVYQIEIGPINNPTYVECLTKEGKAYTNEESECILFPSKHNRDWSTFDKNGKRVLFGTSYYAVFIMRSKAFIDKIVDVRSDLNNNHYDNNNYFETAEEAQIVADKINNIFEEL